MLLRPGLSAVISSLAGKGRVESQKHQDTGPKHEELHRRASPVAPGQQEPRQQRAPARSKPDAWTRHQPRRDEPESQVRALTAGAGQGAEREPRETQAVHCRSLGLPHPRGCLVDLPRTSGSVFLCLSAFFPASVINLSLAHCPALGPISVSLSSVCLYLKSFPPRSSTTEPEVFLEP